MRSRILLFVAAPMIFLTGVAARTNSLMSVGDNPCDEFKMVIITPPKDIDFKITIVPTPKDLDKAMVINPCQESRQKAFALQILNQLKGTGAPFKTPPFTINRSPRP